MANSSEEEIAVKIHDYLGNVPTKKKNETTKEKIILGETRNCIKQLYPLIWNTYKQNYENKNAA